MLEALGYNLLTVSPSRLQPEAQHLLNISPPMSFWFWIGALNTDNLSGRTVSSNIFSKISTYAPPWPILRHTASLTVDSRMECSQLPMAGTCLTKTLWNKGKKGTRRPKSRSPTLSFIIGLYFQISPCSWPSNLLSYIYIFYLVTKLDFMDKTLWIPKNFLK